MATDIGFFELASRSAKSPDVRRLMADLAQRERQCDQLQEEFTKQILSNRSRRTGKPVKQPTIPRDIEQAIQESGRQLAKSVPKLSDKVLLDAALGSCQDQVELHNPSDYHKDDRAFAKRIDRHNRESLRMVEAFFRTHKRSIPKPQRDSSGISFNVAFQRAVKEIGTLGGDNMAIDPAINALDELALQNNLTPLTDFIDSEGPNAAWFAPAAGLATVRGLLEKLRPSSRRVKNARKVIEDLVAIELELVAAAREKVRFHFVMLD